MSSYSSHAVPFPLISVFLVLQPSANEGTSPGTILFSNQSFKIPPLIRWPLTLCLALNASETTNLLLSICTWINNSTCNLPGPALHSISPNKSSQFSHLNKLPSQMLKPKHWESVFIPSPLSQSVSNPAGLFCHPLTTSTATTLSSTPSSHQRPLWQSPNLSLYCWSCSPTMTCTASLKWPPS
jgi:hypothetical protein